MAKKSRKTSEKLFKIDDGGRKNVDDEVDSAPGPSCRIDSASEETDPAFSTKIEDLDDYFLLTLFEYLTVKEKLAIERVCKRWQRIILQMLAKQTGLGTTWTLDEDANCLDQKRDHCASLGDIRAAIPMTNGWFYDFTDPKSLQNLKYLSKKCPNVKCFHLTHGVINHQSLQEIIELFPDFECLHLKGIKNVEYEVTSHLLKTNFHHCKSV